MSVAPTVILAGLSPALALPVLGPVASQHGVSASTATWVLTAAFISSAVATPLLGRCADMFGHRRVIAGGLLFLMVGSLMAAFAPSFAVLVIARTLQGISAPLYPVVISALQTELRPGAQARAIARLTGLMGVGSAVGLVTGGHWGSGGDYRDIFWLPAVLSALSIVFILKGLPHRPSVRTSRIDVLGGVVLSAGLVLLLLPISRALVWGLGGRTVGCLAAGILLLLIFVWVQRRTRDAMIAPGILRRRAVVVTSLISMFAIAALFVPLVALPILMHPNPSLVGESGLTPLQTSLTYLLPGSLLGTIGAPLGAFLIRRYSARAALAWAGGVITVGALLSVAFPAQPLVLAGGVFTATLGLNICYAALPVVLFAGVERETLGVSNSMNSLARWIGSASVTAVVSMLLSLAPVDALPAMAVVRAVFAVGALLGAGVLAMVAFVPGPGREARHA